MTPRRRQTAAPSATYSVRFYKIVALSFLCLTLVLFGVIVFMSSKRATIIVTTRPNPVSLNTTVTVGGSDDGAIAGSANTYSVSSTYIFSPTGSREEPGTAVGQVTLHNDSGTAQPLVKTTRLLTGEGILFRMSEGVTVPANGTATVDVYSDTKGSENNIGPERFTIPGLNEARQKQVYATSDAAMEGGSRPVGIVTDSDIETAKKQARERLETKAREHFTTDMKEDEKLVLALLDVRFDVNAEREAEVSEFSVRASGDAVGVLYDAKVLHDSVHGSLMKRAIDDTEVVEAGDVPPTVTFESYNAGDLTADVTVFYEGLATVNPDSKQLEKFMFFGKTKDEVRRYLLSLDHVHGVEVKFSPAWIRTVPHVGDHVSVIVKEVE